MRIIIFVNLGQVKGGCDGSFWEKWNISTLISDIDIWSCSFWKCYSISSITCTFWYTYCTWRAKRLKSCIKRWAFLTIRHLVGLFAEFHWPPPPPGMYKEFCWCDSLGFLFLYYLNCICSRMPRVRMSQSIAWHTFHNVA